MEKDIAGSVNDVTKRMSEHLESKTIEELISTLKEYDPTSCFTGVGQIQFEKLTKEELIGRILKTKMMSGYNGLIDQLSIKKYQEEEKSCKEAIKEITELLTKKSGEFISDIYSKLLHPSEYLGDNTINVIKRIY